MPDRNLFQAAEIGPWKLQNRIAMAPMTRHRASADWTPAPYAADYYGQRASAGLIITEATQCSAVAAPMPPAAPVITATFPASSVISSLQNCACRK